MPYKNGTRKKKFSPTEYIRHYYDIYAIIQHSDSIKKINIESMIQRKKSNRTLRFFSTEFLEPFNPPEEQLASLLSAWKLFLLTVQSPLTEDLKVCMESTTIWLKEHPS